jgi:release factor glutamine methyltransferase
MNSRGPADAAPVESAPRTAGEMLRRGREFLERKGFTQARLEAELLVAHTLSLDRLRLFLELDRPLSEEDLARGRALIARRARHEPVAYITGTREFYGRKFAVNSSVLIPRPETELLIDRVRELSRARSEETLRLLDVGTGSGAIAITLALELPNTRWVASDISSAALAVARDNATRLNAPPGAIEFLEGDGARGALNFAPFDFVVSNPPYIAHEVRSELEPDVREFEPALALFAPAGDPHHWLKRLLDESPALLAPGGRLLVEIGHDQAQAAKELCLAHGREVRIHLDYAKLPRIAEFG